jgi:inward rectifier potassium channel
MSLRKKLNSNASTTDQTGFGTISSNSAGRFYRKDGAPNRVITGINVFERYSIYHFLLAIPSWKFLLIIFSFYIGVNVVFASIYLLIGIEHLNGIVATTFTSKLGEAFFFSAQTFTTVGYGRISPIGFLTSAVSALEALIGLLSFALATGLLYGRFTKPKAYLRYSRNALLAPYRDGVALMFRLVPYKNNHLTEVEVKVTMAMRVEENGIQANKFYPVDVEISKITFLAYSWTIVHPINERSPLYGLSKTDIENSQAEVLIYVRAFDESFSNTVVSRTSYTPEEFVYGGKFKMMYHPSADQTHTVLNIDKLSHYDEVPLPGFAESN